MLLYTAKGVNLFIVFDCRVEMHPLVCCLYTAKGVNLFIVFDCRVEMHPLACCLYTAKCVNLFIFLLSCRDASIGVLFIYCQMC